MTKAIPCGSSNRVRYVRYWSINATSYVVQTAWHCNVQWTLVEYAGRGGNNANADDDDDDDDDDSDDDSDDVVIASTTTSSSSKRATDPSWSSQPAKRARSML
jgi:hypothetical protein